MGRAKNAKNAVMEVHFLRKWTPRKTMRSYMTEVSPMPRHGGVALSVGLSMGHLQRGTVRHQRRA